MRIGLAGAAPVRIEPALVRIDVVVGGELARLSLERRIVSEEDSPLQPHRPYPAAVRDFRRPGRGRAASASASATGSPIRTCGSKIAMMTWNDGSSVYCCGSSVSMSNCAMRRTLAGSAALAVNATAHATAATPAMSARQPEVARGARGRGISATPRIAVKVRIRVQCTTASALSSTRATWRASRSALPRVRSAIWCRQLVPSATISVSAAAARTAGMSDSSAIRTETS